jgi:glycosyltransferase involved in cell wall biosynthesis
MVNNQKLISIVVPIFDESESIEAFVKSVEELNINFEVIFVCDPCSDDSVVKIKNIVSKNNKNYKTIIMSRRFGQHKCIIAGLDHASGDAVIVMDVDGQDPVEAIPEMIQKWTDGFDVVYGKRIKREKINFINKIVSKFGLLIVSKLSYLDIPTNVGEFRLMDKRVVNELEKMDDFNPFLRGMVSYVGFKQTEVNFIRPKRYAGETKYSKFFGSISFGLNGLTSFSNKLLNFSIILGLIISFISFLIGCFYIYFKLNGIVEFPIGNPTIVISILFIGGLQLFSIGILGLYIGQISDQVRGRPRYIVDELFGEFN